MGARLRFGTAGATGGGFSHQPGSLIYTYEESWHEPKWCYQQRSAKTWKDQYRWRSLWSYGCRIGGGAIQEFAVVGADLSYADPYEPFSCDTPGSQHTKWIKGQCVDASGTAVDAAILRAYRTSDNTYAGFEVSSYSDGTYAIPTIFAGVAHYAVAYKQGSPDIGGTTVNTLVPTDLDGA